MNKKIICSVLGFALYATWANAAYIYQQEPSQYPVEGQSASGQEQRYVALPLVQKSSQMSPEQQAQLLEQQRLQQEKLRQTKQTIAQEKRAHEEFPEQEFDPELKKLQEQEQRPEKPKEEKPQEKPKEEKEEEKPKEGKKEEKPKEKEKEEKPETNKKEKEEKKKEPFKVLYKSDKFNLEKESPESSLKSNLDSQTLTINKKPSKQADESLQKMNEFIQLMHNFGLMSASPQMGQEMDQLMDPITYEQLLLQQDMQPEMLIFKMHDDADESMDMDESLE